ncbi:ABC transporter substrate-binding protein [Hutsoniella sourekii]
MKPKRLLSLLTVLTLLMCLLPAGLIKAEELQTLTLMLDYVPNTNHTGIYWALEKGYYQEAGIDLKIIEPGNDLTSINAVASGQAQLGVSYQEDLTYAHANNETIGVKAIATIMKENTSGFASLKDSGIQSPADFEGKVYAGWQSPSEEAILKESMKLAGADPDQLKIVGASGQGPRGLGKQYDIQWYYEAWDNVKAELDGIELNYMPLKKIDPRLNYYTPIIVAQDKLIDEDTDLVKKFIQATKKGYQETMAHPQEAGELMANRLKEYDREFILKSQEIASKLYTDQADQWGEMEASVWDGYTDFMLEHQLIDKNVDSQALFTNDLLD